MDHQASITESELERMLFDEAAEPKPLPFSLLERITNGFSYKMEIGRGGFAVVYKAMLENGAVAVKRLLSHTYMYQKEFIREVECLMKVKHKNIVRFLGYCVDTQGNMTMYEGKYVMADIQQRLLCFEYLPNGGLDRYIKDPSRGLEWIDRYSIIKGICDGLHHLHELNIVHLDLKPANIILDERMEPKITDFGISRSFEEDQTQFLATKVPGTMGYMAPEFVSKLITKKYDLYSLGVIILEIVTGEKRCQGVESVLKSWSDRLDTSQRNQECEQIRVCVEIGIECTDSDQAKRPFNMKNIIERLPEMERIEEISPIIKMSDINITSSTRSLHSLDTNHTNQWIITGEDDGHVRIWNYQKQIKVDTLKLTERSTVVCVKFIARKQWFAAASGYNIYVYGYATKMQKITSINACSSDKSIHTLALHPTEPYLLSSDYGNIKLWNWDKNWECTQIFETNNLEGCIYQLAFSLKGTIAGASLDCTVKVCSVDSPESNYTLSGHSTSIRCLELFTWDDKEYLVTGSDDQTAKIWDMEQKKCLCTLEAFTSPVIFVLYRPDLQILITGSQDGSIYLWRICSRIKRRPPKLDQTFRIGGGDFIAVACSMGRVVIAKQDAVAIMDIERVKSQEKSTDYSEPELCADTRPDGDKTSKVSAESSEELPILYVDPLELRPFEPNEPIMCSLHLTNKTDRHVAFKITKESRESLRCSSELPMFDILPPRSTFTLVLTTGHIMKLGEETNFNIVVQSSTSGERYIAKFISQTECDEFFDEAEEIGNTVHRVTLKANYMPECDPTSKYYIKLHPLEYEYIKCSLHLTNKTDEYVVFRLVERSSNDESLMMYDALPPRSSCTLLIPYQKTGTDLVLQSSRWGSKRSSINRLGRRMLDDFYDEAEKFGKTVSEVAIKAFHTALLGEMASKRAVRTTVMNVRSYLFSSFNHPATLTSLDAHPTEPWIVIGHWNGNASVWNHENKTTMDSFQISERPVWRIKFHATKKWIVAGTGDELIHVYDCASVSQIQKITSFTDPGFDCFYSVGVHPTKPYVLSSSMNLWDGDKGWKCTHTFGTSGITELAFNPEDPNSFAFATSDVEVWTLDSHEHDYTLSGHSDTVNCLHFFRRGDRQYLITGSLDCTAKIWDLQKRTCIYTMYGFLSPVYHVISIPGRPYLVSCTRNSTIHVWSSIDFRLKTTFELSDGGTVDGLVCLKDSRRIATGQANAITILEIDDDDEEPVVACEGNNEDSIMQANPSRGMVVVDQENAISILKIHEEEEEEIVASKNKNEESTSSGRVMAGQEKAISILQIHDGDEVPNEGGNKKSVVQEKQSRKNGRKRSSWLKDVAKCVWTRVKGWST